MYNTFLPALFCCLFLSTFASAQRRTTWFPAGAQWRYQIFSLAGPAKYSIEHTGRTAVKGGQTCQVLRTIYKREAPFAQAPEYDDLYVYSNRDSVFYWDKNYFVLLYDFTRKVGDIMYYPFQLKASVIRVGDTVWQGIPLRFQDLRFTQQVSPTNLYQKTVRVLERVGGEPFIEYYLNAGFPLSEAGYSLICYRDQQYPQAGSCTLPANEADEALASISVAPNPAPQRTTFSIPETLLPARLQLFNVLGQQLLQRNLTAAETIVDLPPGQLFWQITSAKGQRAGQIFR
jgi:hypothetical protein